MEPITFIGGIVVSILSQIIKKYSINEYTTLLIVLVLSLIAAGVYQYLSYVGYWQSVLSTLVIAGAVYTFIIARFEK